MENLRWADRIGRRLKLRDLHVLSAVVQWGSMARAAQHLVVSQPVVSAAIADLEHAIGVRLLDRSRRGVEPTIYGRAHGIVAFDALNEGIKEIEVLVPGIWRVGGPSKDGPCCFGAPPRPVRYEHAGPGRQKLALKAIQVRTPAP